MPSLRHKRGSHEVLNLVKLSKYPRLHIKEHSEHHFRISFGVLFMKENAPLKNRPDVAAAFKLMLRMLGVADECQNGITTSI